MYNFIIFLFISFVLKKIFFYNISSPLYYIFFSFFINFIHYKNIISYNIINFHIKIYILDILIGLILFFNIFELEVFDIIINKKIISIITFCLTFLSSIFNAILIYFLFNQIFNVNIFQSLILGTILSPTDPISIISFLKKNINNKKIQSIIIGESYFNDIIVIFLIYLLSFKKNNFFYSTKIFFLKFFIDIISIFIIYKILIAFFEYMYYKKKKDYSIIFFFIIPTILYTIFLYYFNIIILSIAILGIFINIYLIEKDLYIKYFIKKISVLNNILNSLLFFYIGSKINIAFLYYNYTVIFYCVIIIFILLISRIFSVFILFSLFTFDKKIKKKMLISFNIKGILSYILINKYKYLIHNNYIMSCIILAIILNIFFHFFIIKYMNYFEK